MASIKIFLLVFINLCSLLVFSADGIIDPRGLVVFSELGKAPLLKPKIGKIVVESLMNTSETKSTTSCRLENKRVVHEDDVLDIITYLKTQGFPLIDREIKDIPVTAKAGTFTFYGTAVKFVESKQLPKTSIKLRIRLYIVEENGVTRRSQGTSKSAFLEIKIKNPFPEYSLSVHKYRLMMPDKDILMLIKSNPGEQEDFSAVIAKLATRAHMRDVDGENQKLIDVMFEQIKILAIAEPSFIKPNIGITYHRISKKYDEEYDVVVEKENFIEKYFKKNKEKGDRKKKKEKKKKGDKKKKREKKTRSYEITIDSDLKAFHVYFSDHRKVINIDKYFFDDGFNDLLIAEYPKHARVVEFKQPDAIGYQGPGKIRGPDTMGGAQKELWLAFVYEFGRRAWPGTTVDGGKFFHVKQFMRIQAGQGKEGEKSILHCPELKCTKVSQKGQRTST